MAHNKYKILVVLGLFLGHSATLKKVKFMGVEAKHEHFCCALIINLSFSQHRHSTQAQASRAKASKLSLAKSEHN